MRTRAARRLRGKCLGPLATGITICVMLIGLKDSWERSSPVQPPHQSEFAHRVNHSIIPSPATARGTGDAKVILSSSCAWIHIKMLCRSRLHPTCRRQPLPRVLQVCRTCAMKLALLMTLKLSVVLQADARDASHSASLNQLPTSLPLAPVTICADSEPQHQMTMHTDRDQ